MNLHTDKSLKEKVREDLDKGFFEVYNNHLETHNGYKELLEEFEKQTEQTLNKFLELHPEYYQHYTGIITSKKRVEIIDYDYKNIKIIKTGRIYPVLNNTKDNLFKGQLVYGEFVPKNIEKYGEWRKNDVSNIWYKEDAFYIRNCQPKKYCCEQMKSQFSFCKQHGLDCPDYFIEYSTDGRYYVNVNKTWSLSYCPFCGREIGDYSGKTLLID